MHGEGIVCDGYVVLVCTEGSVCEGLQASGSGRSSIYPLHGFMSGSEPYLKSVSNPVVVRWYEMTERCFDHNYFAKRRRNKIWRSMNVDRP